MTEEDEAAFDEFLASRGTSLLRTAILVCGASQHDAEDLVQHALEKVYRHWPRIGHDNPEAYARKVVVNAAISASRRRKIIQEITFARPPETAAANPDLDLRDTLIEELRRLPARMRAVLVLRLLGGPVGGRDRAAAGLLGGNGEEPGGSGAGPDPRTHDGCGRSIHMTVEDALKDAMSAHVADVHAPPSLGRAVRRGNRAHVVRFRTAGAALVTAAVAIAVPITLSPSGPSVTGTDRVVVTVTVPDLGGMDVAEADAALKAAGLVPVATGEGVIIAQSPAVGAQVEQGTQVSLTAAGGGQPQDLGDLGDGRTFGGINLGYLPKGLVWSKWSGKNGFGETSYTTSFGEEGAQEGRYSFQVVVYEGEAAKRPKERLDGLPDTSEYVTQVDGVRMYLAELGEDSQPVAHGQKGTPTISWMLRDDLAVEVMMSPDRSATMDWAGVQIELTKIAMGVRPSK